MNAVTIAILAANLAVLYFVFDIACLLRRILTRMECDAPDTKGTFWTTEDPRLSHRGWLLWNESDMTFSTRRPYSALHKSIHGNIDSICETIRHSRPPLGKIRYFAIWRWCGGGWVVEKGSVPLGCEPGPPPDFKGEFESQFVKTEVVRSTR
jgi:hypothetical protein